MKKKIIIIILLGLLLFILFGNTAFEATYGSVHNIDVVISNTSTKDNITLEGNRLYFDTELEVPGDYYEFEYTVKNKGNTKAILSTFSNNVYENGKVLNQLPKYLKYTVTHNDGKEINEGETLYTNSSETYKVRVEYSRDINPEDLPTEDHKYIFSISMNYTEDNK